VIKVNKIKKKKKKDQDSLNAELRPNHLSLKEIKLVEVKLEELNTKELIPGEEGVERRTGIQWRVNLFNVYHRME
jgi:hypothetical protein